MAEELTKVQFTRISVVFSVGGTMYADPDPQVLRMFGESDGVILKPRPFASTIRYVQHRNLWNRN